MSQQYQQQTGQGMAQDFQQSVPMEVSQAVLSIEEFETEAEWAKTIALQNGDGYVAQEIEDLVELANVQKKLIVRQSWHAPTIGQCTQEALQHGSQELQQSQFPEVQRVAQQAQQLAGTIGQASSQVGMGGQSGTGSQQYL